MKNVISAVCVSCGAEHEALPGITTCRKCGGILDIKYDYTYIRSQLTRKQLEERRENSMWRYREFLPVEGTGSRPKLRVGWSPFYEAKALAERLGVSNKTLSKWETSKCMPDYGVVERLCDELGVTIGELLDGWESEAAAPVVRRRRVRGRSPAPHPRAGTAKVAAGGGCC